jgi:hypothetical protein
LEEEKQEEE